jgi:hypothetical protein
MNSKRLCHGAALLIGFGAMSASASATGIFSMVSETETLTAVNSKEYNGYIRTLRADGSFLPETYAFGEGGNVPPAPLVGLVTYDPTIDDVKFPEIVRMIAAPLADQNFRVSQEPDATRLLIMVYWGRNIGRNAIWELDGYNAHLLGFDTPDVYDLNLNPNLPGFGRSFKSALLEQTHFELSDALRVDRYFVILRAYDFQAAWKERKMKLLWDTRFSLSQRRHDFEKDLPAMAHTASLYFGQDSHGLVRIPPVPDGQVYIGNVKTLDDLPDAVGAAQDDALSGIAGDWRGGIPGFPPVVLHVDTEGNSTFQGLPRQSALAARVSVSSGAVTFTVPGWDVLFRGRVKGDEIKGTLKQYAKGGPIVLTKVREP